MTRGVVNCPSMIVGTHLRHRDQCVIFNKAKSDCFGIKTGVPI